MLRALLLFAITWGGSAFRPQVSPAPWSNRPSRSSPGVVWRPRVLRLGAAGKGAGGKSPAAEEQPLPAVVAAPRVQTLDYTTLALVCRELSTVLTPARLEHIVQSDDFTLLIQLRTLEGFRWLLLSWQPESARVALIEDPPLASKGNKAASKSSFYSLPSTLKSYLQYKMLIGVTLPLPGERIAIFEFADRATDTVATYQLYVEVMGRRSNVMLVNPADQSVLACGYQVSPSKSVRAISVGQAYSLPPALLTPMPVRGETTEDEFVRRVSLIPTHDLRKAVLSAYRGFSPQLVDTMAAAAGVNSSAPVEVTGEEGLRRLFQGPVSTWLDVLAGERAVPCGLSADLSKYSPILFPGGAQDDGWLALDSINGLVDRYYSSCLRRREFSELRQRCLSRIQWVLSRLQRTRKEFQDQLDEAGEDNVAALQTRADLLTTYAYSWKEGDTSVQCYEFESGEPLLLPVREGWSAAEEAQDAYKKIRKLKRSIQAVKPLIEQMDLKIAFVEEVETSVLQLGASAASLERDLELLKEIAEEIALDDGRGGSPAPASTFFSTILTRMQGVSPDGGAAQAASSSAAGKGGKKAAKGGKGGKKGAAQSQQASNSRGGKGTPGTKLQSFRLGQCLVYVGRNSRQNDHVSFSMANPTDLWFHARGVPGSHCLLRFDAGTDVDEEELQFAADLAAYFSKARGSGEVPVQWTQAKHLKRVPGGGPGMVQVLKENKVLWGRPERGEKLVEAAEQQQEQREDEEGTQKAPPKAR